MSTFESAFKIVTELSEIFSANESNYLAPAYLEAEVRKDFIDKFFIALGWDVNHDTQRNPYEQEVKVEKGMNIGNAQKRADYAFYLKPNFNEVKFFVEAKKPFRSLLNQDDYFQTIRYGWNANTPIVVLTDFEEFHILDSRFKPDIKNSLDRKIEKFHYSEYANEEKFRRIYHLFSRESVNDDSINKRADKLSKPKGKGFQKGLFKGGFQSIDESFLEELDEIRITLAKSFKRNNPELNSEELTEATQKTIDRLVFIRFLEDKLIEPEHYVSEFGNNNSAWKDFINVSKKLNAKYNGVVFKKHTLLDSDKFLGPDQNEFGNICNELSHTNSPYDFNYIPIHILGSIYERFLGKIIHATEKQVKIEEKPEVRKAHGVYYTPQYIVNNIVNSTIGKLIEGKTPNEISKLKFADISCGSGSFLITVFDFVLQYIGKWYNEHPENAKKDGAINLDGVWILSLKQKRNILLNNIFGVDIDYQAVEVTQLSLFLKLLEDETTATANEMMVLFKEKILPDLSNNIICGNSIVETDIYDDNIFPSETERKINAMNFKDRFPSIMKNGGFDSIVGNPPWGADLNSYKSYFDRKYSNKTKDSAAIFIDKSLLISKAHIGLIVPKTITYYSAWNSIRNEISSRSSILQIIDVGIAFPKVKLESIILILSKNRKLNNSPDIYSASPLKLPHIPKEINFLGKFDNQISLIANIIPFISLNDFETNLILKLYQNTLKVNDIYLDVFRGLYIPDSDKLKLEKGELKFINKVPDVKKYKIEKIQNISLGDNIKWVDKSKKIMVPRLFFKVFRGSKVICYPDINGEYLTTEKLVNFINDFSKYPVSYLFLAGIFNAKISSYYIQRILFSNSTETSRVMDLNYLKHFIVPQIDMTRDYDRKIHDKIVSFVTQIMDCHIRLSSSRTDNEKIYWKQKCISLDNQIEQLVYELFGMKEEDIAIVEGNK